MSSTHTEAHDERPQPDRDAPAVKPEPPPIVTMLRRLEESLAERDRFTAARLLNLCRTLDGSDAANAA